MKNIYILIIIVILGACKSNEENSSSITSTEKENGITISKQQFDSENMKLGTLTEQNFNQEISVSGMVDVAPSNKANVSTFIGGYITNTPLLIGDKVKKGQLLVTLKNIEFVEIQQQYLEIKESLNYLKSEFERQQTLFKEKITSQKKFLNAESNYKSSLAKFNGLRKKLQMLHLDPDKINQENLLSTINIYAPIDGNITKVHVTNGAYINSNEVILEIVNTDHLNLELDVFEKDILKVKQEQLIQFNIPESSNKTFKASVHLVGTSIDESNRTVKVHGDIDNEQTIFIVGMFVEANIIIDSKAAAALPTSAIFKTNDSYYVLALDQKTTEGYQFKKINIKKGDEKNNYTEVLNAADLTNNKILINGTYMLSEF